jgi:hypothetical protein
VHAVRPAWGAPVVVVVVRGAAVVDGVDKLPLDQGIRRVP